MVVVAFFIVCEVMKKQKNIVKNLEIKTLLYLIIFSKQCIVISKRMNGMEDSL